MMTSHDTGSDTSPSTAEEVNEMATTAPTKPQERRIAKWDRRHHPHILRHPFHPLVLGLFFTMLIVFQSNIRGMDRGTTPPMSYFVAGIALAASLALIVGWLRQDVHTIKAGYLLVAAAYMTRATFIMLVNPWDQSVLFSLASAFIAGGAFIAESANLPGGRRE